jgi:intraflagellar transport protein 80
LYFLNSDVHQWSYSRERTRTGSLYSLTWSSDGTQIAGAGGNGSVCFGNLVERRSEWGNVSVTLGETNHIQLRDVNSDNNDELSFRDRVVKFSLGYDYLIVTTSNQCHIHNYKNRNPSIVFDLKDTVNLIVQSEKNFLTVDNFVGVQVYNYAGRLISNPKFSGLRTEFINSSAIALSKDYVAILDPVDRKVVHLMEVATGKKLDNLIKHSTDISEICINQYGSGAHRKVAFIDKNKDLWVSSVQKSRITKVSTMVSSVLWNDKTDTLAAVIDGNFVTWSYPNVLFYDKDLANVSKSVRDLSGEYGANCTIAHFYEKTCSIRRADGALVTISIPPYTLLLYEFAEKPDWENCLRLCRFANDRSLWACLGGMAVDFNELSTAEVCFASLGMVDRLQFINHIKHIPSQEGRNSEMYLFKGMVKEAESVLLQAGLTYRSIKMNIKLFRWDRALELAVKFKTHVDTVIAFRNKYLDALGKPESHPEFLKYSQGVTE